MADFASEETTPKQLEAKRLGLGLRVWGLGFKL